MRFRILPLIAILVATSLRLQTFLLSYLPMGVRPVSCYIRVPSPPYIYTGYDLYKINFVQIIHCISYTLCTLTYNKGFPYFKSSLTSDMTHRKGIYLRGEL